MCINFNTIFMIIDMERACQKARNNRPDGERRATKSVRNERVNGGENKTGNSLVDCVAIDMCSTY